MSPYFSLALLGLLAVVQVTLVPAAALGSTKPFLPLLAVISWGLLRGPLAGIGWALAAGVMLDVLSPTPFGYYTVALVLGAMVVAAGRGRLFPGNLLLPFVTVVGATLAFTAAQLAPYLLAGRLAVWAPDSLVAFTAKSILLGLLWLPVVYFPLRLAARRAEGPRIDWER